MNGNEDSIPRTDQGEPSGSPQGDVGGFLASFGVAVEPELLQLALTHRSWAFEHDAANNERLEFLGDSILGQAVAVKLFTDYPELPEGDLAKRRAALVSTKALAEIARGIGLGMHLRLGKGEKRTGGRDKDSILADTVEAIIGAVFLSTDHETAHRFVLELIAPLVADPDRFERTLDPKTTLQVEAAKRGMPHPTYETTGEGPDHDRRYTARVELAGFVGVGTATSKKAAELEAARDAAAQIHGAKAQKKRK